MPHLLATYTGQQAKERSRYLAPGGHSFECLIDRIERLEIIGSSFKDPGPDWCDFRAFDAHGSEIGYKRVEGY